MKRTQPANKIECRAEEDAELFEPRMRPFEKDAIFFGWSDDGR